MTNLIKNSSAVHSAWQKPLPWLIIALLFAATALLHHVQGRCWWCACGGIWPWAGDIWSQHCSQHLFDPYSFTHILHGVMFWMLLTWLLPRMPLTWRLCLAVFLEAGWEVLENSSFVIDRYRSGTISLGYEGDSIANSLADILCCGLGFLLAARLGWWRALIFFVATELILLAWIRDGLILNIIMLIHPIDAIKTWQSVH